MPKHKKAQAIIQMLREQEEAEYRLSNEAHECGWADRTRMFEYAGVLLSTLIVEAERSLNE